MTTLQPRWRQTRKNVLAVWEYAIPNRFWCHILALFGIWTISGRITTCDDKSPIPGAVVSIFDADWLQDDPLGTETTDATGHYVLTYLASDFRRTPFSPSLNVELTEGPDVYAKVELGGQPIITETQADGRKPGRQNVGHCFCLDLCTDKVVGGPETTPHWQQVEVFDIHPGNGLPGSTFDTLGYADPAGGAYVFGGSVTLRGNCPLTDIGTGHPLKYRFLVGEYTWTGGTEDPANPPTVAPGSLTPVTTQVTDTHVGYVSYTDGNGQAQSSSVFVTAADLDPPTASCRSTACPSPCRCTTPRAPPRWSTSARRTSCARSTCWRSTRRPSRLCTRRRSPAGCPRPRRARRCRRPSRSRSAATGWVSRSATPSRTPRPTPTSSTRSSSTTRRSSPRWTWRSCGSTAATRCPARPRSTCSTRWTTRT